MKKVLIFIILLGTSFLFGCTQQRVGSYIPGIYYAVDQQTSVSVYINVNEKGFIDGVLFDQPYEQTTAHSAGDAYVLPSGHSWKDEASYLASYIVLNQGWGNIQFNITDISGMNSINVPEYFARIDYVNSPSVLNYFTMPLDGFLLSWNLAIKNASTSDIGVIEDVPTSEEWLLANQPPYTYVDGVYYGVDAAHGYIVRVVIENGFITDVVFDAITAINTRIVWNDNGTPNDASDDFPIVEVVSMTTKQALQDQLIMVSGEPWYEASNKMRDAIIDRQGWNPAWVFEEVTGHEYFDFSDSETLDAVAGVSIAIEGFRLTFQEAIEKAILD